jgi:hypothetical protein
VAPAVRSRSPTAVSSSPWSWRATSRPSTPTATRWAATVASCSVGERHHTARPSDRRAPAAFGPRATRWVDPRASARAASRPHPVARAHQARIPKPVLATRMSGGWAMIRSVSARNSSSAGPSSVRSTGPRTTSTPSRERRRAWSSPRRSAVTPTVNPARPVSLTNRRRNRRRGVSRRRGAPPAGRAPSSPPAARRPRCPRAGPAAASRSAAPPPTPAPGPGG